MHYLIRFEAVDDTRIGLDDFRFAYLHRVLFIYNINNIMLL